MKVRIALFALIAAGCGPTPPTPCSGTIPASSKTYTMAVLRDKDGAEVQRVQVIHDDQYMGTKCYWTPNGGEAHYLPSGLDAVFSSPAPTQEKR